MNKLNKGTVLFLKFYLAFYFLLLSHIYLKNMGEMPNALTWIYVCIGFIVIILRLNRQVVISVQKPFLYILAGVLLFTSLIVSTPSQSIEPALIIIACIVSSLLIYFLLLQIRLSFRTKNFVVIVVFFGGVIESCISLSQFFKLPLSNLYEFPRASEQRPYAVFQQINLLASYISTAIGAAFHIVLTSNYKRRNIIFYAGNVLFGFILVICQSQVGYLSAVLVVFLYMIVVKNNTKYKSLLVISLLSGVVTGILVQSLIDTPIVSHVSSTKIRLALLSHSWDMFLLKPWLGWGIGSFEYNFAHLFGGGISGVGTTTISHPHNEIFLWIVSGGVVGILAVICIIVGILLLAIRSKSVKFFSFLIISVPILLHTQTEYPLYQSAPHFIILILMIRFSTPDAIDSINTKEYTIPLIFRVLLLIIAISILFVLSYDIYLQRKLTDIEREGTYSLLNENQFKGWLSRERFNYDLNVGYLLAFNETKDSSYLVKFEKWGFEYIKTNPDANVYRSLLIILSMNNRLYELEKLKSEFEYIFPEFGALNNR